MQQLIVDQNIKISDLESRIASIEQDRADGYPANPHRPPDGDAPL